MKYIQKNDENVIVAMCEACPEAMTDDNGEWLEAEDSDIINVQGRMYYKQVDDAQLMAILEDIKAAKCEEINQARTSARETETFTFKGDEFDVTEISQANLTGFVILANTVPEHEFTYRSATNRNHSFRGAELMQLGIAMTAKIEEIFFKSWALKERVETAATIEEVEAVKWA